MAKFIVGKYNPSETLKIQGSFQSVRPYFKKDYTKVRENNGNWILNRPAGLNMTFEENGQLYTFDMKESAQRYFDKKRMSEKTANDFIKGVEQGLITVTINENGFYKVS